MKHFLIGMTLVTLVSLAIAFLHRRRAMLSAIRRRPQNRTRSMHRPGATRCVAFAPRTPIADSAVVH